MTLVLEAIRTNVPRLIVAFIAEGFYAYRIKVLSRSNWVAGLVLFVSVPI